MDVEVVLQEYDHLTGVWADRARCGNLQRSTDVAGDTVTETTQLDFNNNEKEILNDGFGSVRPEQLASQIGTYESDYKPWQRNGPDNLGNGYARGKKVTYKGKCFVAGDDAAVLNGNNNGIPPSVGGSTSRDNAFWIEVECPHHVATGYITNPDDNNGGAAAGAVGAAAGPTVQRPDFTCRLPAVYWPRNAAVRFDSAVHDTFRFKVRGCFLHEASFYSASGEQRSCQAGETTAEVGSLGYAAPDATRVDAVALKEALTDAAVPANILDQEKYGETRVVLADMLIAGTADSYYNVRHFGKPERAAVLRQLGKHLGLSPTHVLFETFTQSDKQAKVKVAFVVPLGSIANVIDLLANKDTLDAATLQKSNALLAALKSGINGLNNNLATATAGTVSFSNARDMLNYEGNKNFLSGSLVFSGESAQRVVSSASFRQNLNTIIASKVGVAPSSVQVTSVVAQPNGRRLGAVSRKLLQTAQDTVRVTFTIVTDADSSLTSSREAITAKLQLAVNDGTVVKTLNAQTGLNFESAVMGTTSTSAEQALDRPNYLAWAIAVTGIVVVLVIVVVAMAVMMLNGSKRGAGAVATVDGGKVARR
jgi:hypothetical protein